MAWDILHSELARQREAELERLAARHAVERSTSRGRSRISWPQSVTIRLAAAADERELGLLAQRHGAAPPVGPSLIAELGGTPVAALSLHDHAVIAEPGERTTDAVELLRVRATQLLGDAPHRANALDGALRFARALTTRRNRKPDLA